MGIGPTDLLARGLVIMSEINSAAAYELIALSFEHLCREHAG